MTSTEAVQNPSPEAWDEFVCTRRGHLLQTHSWGKFKSSFGWSSSRIALRQNNALVAGAQILYRQLVPGLLFAYVPRGPVCDPSDLPLFNSLMESLVGEARRHGAFMLKIEPDWLLSPSGDPPPYPMVQSFDFLPMHAIQPRTTIHVDLTRNLDDILAAMKSKWRYNIRLADRKGVKVRSAAKHDMSTFYGLLKTTSERDRFPIHSLDYYSGLFDLLAPRDEARIFIAEYESEPLAAIFVTAFSAEAIYLYGASGNSNRERMPNHALHWAAMEWAKERGCARYDMWGIPDVQAGEESALPESLYQFKQGFGGEVVRYVGAYDKILSPVRHLAYRAALRVRRRNWT